MSHALAGLPLCCVVWDDAHGRAGGEYTAEEIARDLHQPAVIKTFGLLLQDDERGVTVVQEVTSGDEDTVTYRGVGFVPRGMVREVVHLGVPRRPRTRRKAR
jgi:hypothetical protein